MKRFFTAACMLFVFSLCSSAQGKNETAIRKLLHEQTEAWNRGDSRAFMKGYWEDDALMFIGKSGVTYGWTKTLENYQKNYPDQASMGKLDFTLIQIKRLSRKYYHVTGKWQLTRTRGDISGHYTLLLKKIKRNWVIVLDHSS